LDNRHGDSNVDGERDDKNLRAEGRRSPYLTVDEAAQYLRTTRQGMYSLVKRNKVKSMPGRPGRLLFTTQELDKYLTGKFRR
jgi:excisionase family DNA binding protein